jgi:hypothetical protein
VFADRFAIEFPPHERPHLWQGIQPGEQLGAWFGAFQPLIQFFANAVRQAGDFAIATFHVVQGFCCWPVILNF